MRGNSVFTLVLLGALGYVAYEMFGQGKTLGQALTFGGVLPAIPGLAGLGCANCYAPPTPGLGYITATSLYGGYAPPAGMTSIPTRTERMYNARLQ